MQWQALFDLSAGTAAGARCLYPQVPHQFVPCEALEAAEFCRGAEVLGRVPVQLTLLLLRSLGLPVFPFGSGRANKNPGREPAQVPPPCSCTPGGTVPLRLHEPRCLRGLFRDVEKPSWGRGSKVHFFVTFLMGSKRQGEE